VREYTIGAVTRFAKTKTEARALAELSVSELIGRVAATGCDSVVAGIGDTLVVMVLPTVEGWCYGYMGRGDVCGRVIGTWYGTRARAADAMIAHVADNAFGDPRTSITDINAGEDWVRAQCRHWHLTQNQAVVINADITYKRDRRRKMLEERDVED